MQEGIEEGNAINAMPDHVPVGHSAPVSLNQQQLDDLIRHKHNNAYDKGKKEGLAEAEARLRAEMEAKIKHELDPEKLRQMMNEHHEKMAQEHHCNLEMAEANKVINEFMHKMSDGESPDPSADELVKNLKLENMAPIVELANESPHTRHIMYELAKNPQKMANLVVTYALDKNLARHEMKKLSDSIQLNKTAQPHDSSKPLSQVQPSNIALGSGKLSIKDLRRQAHLIR